MDIYEYKQIILAEVRAHARADAQLATEGTEADYRQVYDHYRSTVEAVLSRYERISTPAMALVDEMAEAYCRALRDALPDRTPDVVRYEANIREADDEYQRLLARIRQLPRESEQIDGLVDDLNHAQYTRMFYQQRLSAAQDEQKPRPCYGILP